MNYSIVEKNLFDSDAKVLVHQVNCMGVMGSGIAKQIKEKFPIVFQEYENAVRQLQTNCLGGCLLVDTGTGIRIANLFGQYLYRNYTTDYDQYESYKQPGVNGQGNMRFTNYEAFYRGLVYLKSKLGPQDTKIAFPYNIGCDRGGADWKVIEGMIISVFSDTNIDIEICRI